MFDATAAVSTSIEVLIELACVADNSCSPGLDVVEEVGVSSGIVPADKSVE